MRCTPCWLLIWQDQSTGYTAFFFAYTPEITIAQGEIANVFQPKKDRFDDHLWL
jgi:hypothetical protein